MAGSTSVPTYQNAQQTLHNILADPLFHTPAQPMPWWMRALQWIVNHIHLNLGANTLRDVGLVLVGICFIVLIVAAVMVWRISRNRAEGRAIRISLEHRDTSSLLKDARSAFADEDYAQMLHFLVEAQLLYASVEGVVRIRPSKTLRAYRREFERENYPLLPVFSLCTDVAEGVWFGKRTLSPAQAKTVLEQVETALLPKGVEVS